MKRTLLTIATAATFFLTATGIASAQFVANQNQGQAPQSQQGRRYGPNDGTGNKGQRPKDGTGYGAKAGKRANPQNCPRTPAGPRGRGGRR